MLDELFKDLLPKIFQLHSLYSRRIILNNELTESQKEVGFANLKTSRIPLGRLWKITHSLETCKQKQRYKVPADASTDAVNLQIFEAQACVT
jgi:hypothetical protein